MVVPPSEIQAYVDSISRPEDERLAALRAQTVAMPVVGVMIASPHVAQLLQLLIRASGARSVLEIGTFTGYGTMAIATALPADGRVVSLDISEKWPAIGRDHWRRAGCEDRIDLRTGPAVDTMDELIRSGMSGRFDLAFVDANKDGYVEYLDRCLVLLRKNALMVFDNTLFEGRVVAGYSEERIRAEQPTRPRSLQDMYVAYTEGLRRFNARIRADERVDVIVLPITDGVTIARTR